MKKLSKTLKIILILAVLAIAFLVFAIVTASFSLNKSKNSIASIGKVTYSVESKQLIDTAIDDYEALDKTVGLTTTFGAVVKNIVDYSTLYNAKTEYVRLAIKTAKVADQRRYVEGYTTEEILVLVEQARSAYNDYFTESEYAAIENYSDLIYLEQTYGSDNSETDNNSSQDNGSSGDESEEIELC